MRRSSMSLLAGAALALAGPAGPSHAQTALTGHVTSADEGAMEGVLVTARRDGSTMAITVVSDAQARYSFPPPSSRPVTLRSRSARSATTSIPSRPPTLRRAKAPTPTSSSNARNIASQLSNAEWIESVPGTPAQKDALFNCVGCHTVERIVRSTHDADEFVQTMKRMTGYANQSLPVRPQRRKAQRLLEERGNQREALFRKRAEWLASINLSTSDSWQYPLRTLPRPRAARRK